MTPKFTKWHDNKNWIVEYPGAIHSATASAVLCAMVFATGTGVDHLMTHTDPHSKRPPAGEPNIEPDAAFGPRRHVGAVLPPGLTRWIEYHTVKVEIGVFQRWSGLNRKAALWKARVGVEFVLSIRLSPMLRVCEYRLERRVGGRFPDRDNRAPILPIDANAVLEFNAHQLLALPADAALPVGFNDPVRIHLFDKVEQIRILTAREVGDDGDGGGDEDAEDEDDSGQGGGGPNVAQHACGDSSR